jgi:predicted phage terminase large subunit-like protein
MPPKTIKISKQEVVTERCRRSFRYFVSKLRPEFEVQWFHERICNEIQAWADRDLTDEDDILLLAIPPGHAKSTYARMATTWLHGRDPFEQMFYISYAAERAEEHCGLIQEDILSENYKKTFPEISVNEKRSVTDIEGRGPRRNMKMHDIIYEGRAAGWLRAVGLDGGITGGRASTIVIDDPIKGYEQANSPTMREKLWRNFLSAVTSRKMVGRPLKILVLFTRWHLDDLAGRIKSSGMSYHEVRFEALRVDMTDPDDPREEGDALWPEARTKAALERIREIDSEIFQSLYQNDPAPPGGNVIKINWTNNRWSVIPNGGQGRWVQAWDLRLDGDGATSSNAVGQLWFVPETAKGFAYLVDQVKGRWSSNETLDMMLHVNSLPLWKMAGEKYVENKALGKPVINMLSNKIPGLIAYNPGTANKRSKWESVKPFWAAGNVFLPDNKEWLSEFVNEHIMAPAYVTDDQIDCSTIALSALFLLDAKNKETYSWL